MAAQMWNDDDRDVSYVVKNFNPVISDASNKPKPITKILKELYEEEMRKFYCWGSKEMSSESSSDDDYEYCSYKRYTDRNLSWSDEHLSTDSPSQESNSSDSQDDFDEDTEIDSIEKKDIKIEHQPEDVVENMIYRKFCYL